MKAVVTCVSALAAGALFAPAAGARVTDLEILTQGAGGAEAQYDTEYIASAADLSRIYFETDGSLVAEDPDANEQDVYEATGTQTRFISTGPADEHESRPGRFEQASADGSRVFFSSGGVLVDADEDDGDDVYVRAGDRDVRALARAARQRVDRPDELRGRDGRRLARLVHHRRAARAGGRGRPT